ncbi:hypothetical protein BayCH28_23865 [Mycolicibacterium sp. CH28]|uniref:hypothetical protein n=1 Tax=Mycolicibacterium sp. CH28 TaxID=2512237 RepID=UPI00107FFE19|nr:hypothetical protein [Mycolicibacterium sp. CH28]TGD84950.1 hypothetical protein BayCH28_23865 [Mycolicibacterium sp. CH28]
MTIDAGLARDLRLLTAALDEPGADIAVSLLRLAADTKAAVPSYLGLSVSVSGTDPLFTFTDLADGASTGTIATSLRLMLPGVGDGAAPSVVALTFYAGLPGAFVDLAADLAWLTALPPSDFVLDQNTTTPTDSRCGTRVATASVVNQAVGVLIGRGFSPAQADRQIDTRAANAGTDRQTAATLIIAMLGDGDVGPDVGNSAGLK